MSDKPPILYAVLAGNLDCVKERVEAGGDIDWMDGQRGTALMQAAQRGHRKILEYLIDKGADVNLKNPEGITALDWASDPGIADILAKSGAVAGKPKDSEEKPFEPESDGWQPEEDVTKIDFWRWDVSKENYGSWKQRIDASSVDPYSILSGFLASKDPSERAKAINALYDFRVEPVKQIIERVLELLESDEDLSVQDRAAVFCDSYKIKGAKYILLRHLETYSDAGLVHEDIAGLILRFIQVLETLDAQEALPFILKLNRQSPYLSRFTKRDVKPVNFPAKNVGEYVNLSVGHSPLFSGRTGPSCPSCEIPLPEIIRLYHPLGPADPIGNQGVPFFRCMYCVMHSPLYIKLGPPLTVLEVPDVDQYPEECRYDDDGEKWAVRWSDANEADDADFCAILGGEPDWVHDDETPTCPECKAKMAFACELGNQERTFDVVEFGCTDYFFWCGKCRVTASIFQSD